MSKGLESWEAEWRSNALSFEPSALSFNTTHWLSYQL
jgi:hypothetical protein